MAHPPVNGEMRLAIGAGVEALRRHRAAVDGRRGYVVYRKSTNQKHTGIVGGSFDRDRDRNRMRAVAADGAAFGRALCDPLRGPARAEANEFAAATAVPA